MAANRGHTADGNERFWFDTFSAVLLFFTAIGGAWLPKYLCSHGAHVSGPQSLAFHLGNMLSAGVMLSAGFCHLLADAHRYLLFVGRFPVSNFLAATGYIITLLADQVVQYVTDQQEAAAGGDGAHASGGSSAGAAAGGGRLLNGGYAKLPTSTTELTTMPAGGTVASSSEGNLTTAVLRESAAAKARDPEHGAAARVADGEDGKGLGARSSRLLSSGTAGGALSEDEGCRLMVRKDSGSARRPEGASDGGGGKDCHGSGVVALLGGRKLSFATAVLLASALCIHSILEGMALGAQQSMRSTEDIMVAIAAHKGLAAYALGASIVESGASSNRFWTVIGCFSMATPIGIFAGYGMSSAASSKSGAALSALASGTFLYVAFMEVIPKELADGRHRAAKMGAFLLGYGLMSLLAVWA
ncbi:hypothetical protein GPECTOR_14g66 [Gonium pectorale]|uniref:ZIP protein n=1 Tax=Gonium pectorale TaxID=33097 RepID=A0A150GMX7_GONPE|nr:hypothetical protein GPECTOR_14g66 [Gonium pectorale]|eukprot:KXZ51082.1 hypothetical protein GPECTOR_14g66 [Gonium pectorale]